MNNIFKKQDKIVLDDNWYLEQDGGSGVCLVFHEPRTREKVDDKKVKTGETEDFIFEDRRYYPTVHQTLSRYFELSQNAPSKDLKELSERTNKLFKIIEEFRDKYRNW